MARDSIVALLREVKTGGHFAARRTVPAGDLRLEVEGVGRIRFPVSATQARALCLVSRPARYGKGERTLLDRRVRDTWEVPKSRVRIEAARWNRTLLPLLEKMRADLGLPATTRLKARWHSLLVYAPSQFFLRHQDSETADAMLGTMVVTLPSSFRGGAFVVEHQGEKVEARTSGSGLSCVAFYSDCHHEVRPVTQGYRVVLTFDLLRAKTGRAAAEPENSPGLEPVTIAALAERLRQHFATPVPETEIWNPRAPRTPPNRLVFLLDHQYTKRALSWDALKGSDAARVAALRAAAAVAGCDVALALSEVHETWGCEEEFADSRWGWRGRRSDGEDDEDDDVEDAGEDEEGHTLTELHDSELTLHRWIPRRGKAETISSGVRDHEACAITPSSELEPYASEHEGYMGNWGNTVDRWYHRGALVVWPRERTFAVRARDSASWALARLGERLRAGQTAEARGMAAALTPFWRQTVSGEKSRASFALALQVAAGLDDPAAAALLLNPFRVEALSPGRARAFAALLARYGEAWGRSLLAGWSAGSGEGDGGLHGEERRAWFTALPALCTALRSARGAAGVAAARLVLQDRWPPLQRAISGRESPPSLRGQELASLVRPTLGWLEGAGAVAADDLSAEAEHFLCASDDDARLVHLVQLLRQARDTARLDALRSHCAGALAARLEHPARAEGDWSITLPAGCRCELCARLAAFLADPRQRRLEWPLAKDGRAHVHARLDAHELPVRHATRRTGSPYTLVLDKSEALFEREAERRRRWQEDLDWLAKPRARMTPAARRPRRPSSPHTDAAPPSRLERGDKS